MDILDEKYSILPDGRQFAFWDCETAFTKTYYVSKADNACDSNPGTKEQPFATINKAAQVLMPGERVEIGTGVYDEFVNPARGGDGPAKMISYEAAPGERVVITGAREYKNGWKKPVNWAVSSNRPGTGATNNSEAVYEGHFVRGDFELVNPFSMVNQASHPWVEEGFYIANAKSGMDWGPFFQRRGLLFCNGEKLKQVNSPRKLASLPGSYWVEDSGYKFLLHLKDSGDPADHTITFTCREQLFAPSVEGTQYIRVSGLEFECVGNGVPGTQKGALSTHMGNHWIIENNKVRWANSIGIDIGQESTVRNVGKDWISGGTIVRGNHVSNCGICGIAGLPGGPMANESILIERNTLVGNCWHDIQFNWESAAIKVHLVRSGLIRFNTIIDTVYGDGIWTDFANRNERVCYNFIFNTLKAAHGAIFVESSDVANRVDHNVIIGSRTYRYGPNLEHKTDGGHGVFTCDGDNTLIDSNVIFEAEGDGIHCALGSIDRLCNGHGAIGSGHEAKNNIIGSCNRAIVFASDKNFSDGSLIDENSLAERYSIAVERSGALLEAFNIESVRRYHKWEENGCAVALKYDSDIDKAAFNLEINYGDRVAYKTIAIGQPFDLDDIRR
ncbi:MAG: right-handed parallel beta-helix repeat-containing protein [Oscillospiraceae bacterium]|nr:right-handed parallel beta-helix repeat-containing protein [Oscillospiraceae bacterium]